MDDIVCTRKRRIWLCLGNMSGRDWDALRRRCLESGKPISCAMADASGSVRFEVELRRLDSKKTSIFSSMLGPKNETNMKSDAKVNLYTIEQRQKNENKNTNMSFSCLGEAEAKLEYSKWVSGLEYKVQDQQQQPVRDRRDAISIEDDYEAHIRMYKKIMEYEKAMARDRES
jgi:hypothetical protein